MSPTLEELATASSGPRPTLQPGAWIDANAAFARACTPEAVRALLARVRDLEGEAALAKDAVSSLLSWMDRALAAERALAFAEAELVRSQAWSAGRAADIVTLGAALGAALAQVEALTSAARLAEREAYIALVAKMNTLSAPEGVETGE
jgi:hypothetical protein